MVLSRLSLQAQLPLELSPPSDKGPYVSYRRSVRASKRLRLQSTSSSKGFLRSKTQKQSCLRMIHVDKPNVRRICYTKTCSGSSADRFSRSNGTPPTLSTPCGAATQISKLAVPECVPRVRGGHGSDRVATLRAELGHLARPFVSLSLAVIDGPSTHRGTGTVAHFCAEEIVDE